MNKSVLYISLLFCFILVLNFIGLYKYYQNDIVLEKNGLQFIEININQLVIPHGEPFVFITTDSTASQKKLYKFDGYGRSHQIDLHSYSISDLNQANDELFIKAINGQLIFEDTLSDLSTTELITLVSETKNIEARQLVQHTFESGIFGFLDDSPYIFLLIALIVFSILWFLDGITAILKHFFNRDFGSLIHGTIIIFFVILLSSILPSWRPFSSTGNWGRVLIFMIPSFLLFKYLNAKYFRQLDFPDRELFKFITLFFGSYFFYMLGNKIGFFIDSTQFDQVMKETMTTPEAGFIFSLSLGNLCNNIRKHLRYLSGNEKLLQKSNQQVLASKAELDALQASVNPHFLYNALNAIASLAKRDANKTEQMALSLSAFYQYITNKEQEHLSSLAEEIKMIENYLEIEKIRFGENLKISIQHTSEALACKLPRFILQPILENAIKYGYHQDKISVEILAEFKDNELNIKIFDSGKAFDDSLTSGYGLKSVAKKLGFLFPQKHRLEFINQPRKHVFISIQQN